MEQNRESRNKPTHLWSISLQQRRQEYIIHWGKETLFKWCWKSWRATTCKSVKLEHSLTPYIKINSKWFKDINIGHDTIKPLEENIGKTFRDINYSNIFLDQSPKAKEINKSKYKQMGPNQTYKLLLSKRNHKQNKKSTYGVGENICK